MDERKMSGFLGTYTVSLDDKGRLNVPAKFKNVLEESYGPHIVTVVMEDYLVVFPASEWEENEKLYKDRSALSPTDRDAMRQYYARASECEIKSGKILVPQFQREATGLNKEVVIVGMSSTFEIWDSDRWAKNGPGR